jgi:fibronectin type 3 domain-containing protein
LGQIVGWASGPHGQRAVRLLPTTAAATTPAAPTNLSGTAPSRTRIRLTWSDNSTNEAGFRVQRALGTDGSFTTIARVDANVPTYTDSTAKAGKLYRYRVRAFNDVGPSAWSNVLKIRARR